MTRTLTGLGILVALCLPLVGCSPAPATAGVDDAFAARALAVCVDVMASKRAWTPFPAGAFDPTKPDPAKLAKVGEWLEADVAPTFATWRDQIDALGDPASGQDGWAAVVAGVASNVSLNADQIAAAKAGDPAAFASATRDLQASHTAFVAATKAAGVAACGDIVAS